MLDLQWIKAHPELLDKALARRGEPPAAEIILNLDSKRRAHIAKVQDAQTKRNQVSKNIGQAKAQGDEAKAQDLMKQVAELKVFLKEAEDIERDLTHDLNDVISRLPNIPMDDVPDGADESCNVVARTHEVSASNAINQAKEHFDLGEALGLMDFDAAAKMSGARFVVLKGALARLERALGQFMLDTHVNEHGYMEVSPPVLLRDEALYGTAQLPKFADDLFKTTEGRWLAPTAEVPLTNLVRESQLKAKDLPLRLTALTPCFRSEAGSAGRDTRGMLRQHQFNKVELVSITPVDQSADELERMTSCAEKILQKLGLAYRVMTLCTGDMGFSARKTYDLEVWMPGQQNYREISSCSICGDFQARRMMTRYRDADGELHFVHTLNGSGVATGRALIAVMENYQNEDGSITIPEVLRPYMGGDNTLITK
jgi:seryl-tRNA synthetase